MAGHAVVLLPAALAFDLVGWRAILGHVLYYAAATPRKLAIIRSVSGQLSSISGRLNPINDGQYYVYGDNIAINGCLAHPAVYFNLGQSLHLTDANGMETYARFLVVEGQFSLIEYTDPKPYGEAGH